VDGSNPETGPRRPSHASRVPREPDQGPRRKGEGTRFGRGLRGGRLPTEAEAVLPFRWSSHEVLLCKVPGEPRSQVSSAEDVSSSKESDGMRPTIGILELLD